MDSERFEKDRARQAVYHIKSCHCYPCHDLIKADKPFDCRMCWCPLYHFSDCGGDFTILENGVKDCSKCLRPHSQKEYWVILDQLERTYARKAVEEK